MHPENYLKYIKQNNMKAQLKNFQPNTDED